MGQTARLGADEDPLLSRQASEAAIPYPLFPLFPKSKKKGLNTRCTHPGRVGAPLPFAQGLLRKAKPRGQGPAGGD